MGILDSLRRRAEREAEEAAWRGIKRAGTRAAQGNNCPKCRKPIQPGLKFCPSCGAKLVATCANCRNEFPVGIKFCGRCVAKL